MDCFVGIKMAFLLSCSLVTLVTTQPNRAVSDQQLPMPVAFLPYIGCLFPIRLKGLPLMAAFCRRQLFSYLEHSAALMVAFHYAHTDAAQSMLHFDLLLQDDLQAEDGAQAGADAADSAKARIIEQVRHHIQNARVMC